MSETPKTESVRVTIVFTYDLPADLSERALIYGTIDPGECVAIDLGNDPLAFMGESEYEVIGVQIAGGDDECTPTEHAERQMCAPGKHDPIFRGVLGGYFCARCGAFDYDGDNNWKFNDE